MELDDPRPNPAAPQQGPRPLPLFLDMVARETADAPERRAAALAGLRAYQAAERPPPPPALSVARRIGRAALLSAGGAGTPVLFAPSLINPSNILDLDEERSLVRWAAAQGFAAHLLDWGYPAADERELDVGGHVERFLLPAIRSFERPPVLVGYCLGGTMAIAAAARTRVAGLATIAAPWRFAGYGENARAVMAELWAAAQPAADRLGAVPMEVLQIGFWRLDPARTVSKYEAFGRTEPGSSEARAFVRLEDWANAGAPLTYAAGRQLFGRFVARDDPGEERWIVGGEPVRRTGLDVPALEIVATGDRIVPAAAAAGFPVQRDVGAGHVGMIAGRARAKLRAALGDWLSGLE